jgi:hypothetical protein
MATSPVASASTPATAEHRKLLLSAPPPWHAIACWSCMAVVFLAAVPSLDDIDRHLTLDNQSIFVRRVLPRLVPNITILIAVRATFAAIIWCTTIQMCCFSNGWIQSTHYLRGKSKLHSVPNHLVGLKTLFPFTTWSWILLGVYFTLAAYIPWEMTYGDGHRLSSPTFLWINRIALVCWEVAGPMTLLVAAVIRYVIWPGVIQAAVKDGRNISEATVNLKKLRNKLMHNGNAMMALAELCCLGSVPVVLQHVSFAPLYGLIYVLFSWNINDCINRTSDVGVQYLYFFFDTTVPGYFCSVALVALLSVMLFFYMIFASADVILQYLTGGVTGSAEDSTSGGDGSFFNAVIHIVFAVVVCASVVRFRD